jgi:small-conductance mechanosensitive channel
MIEPALAFIDSLFTPLIGQTYAEIATALVVILIFFLIAKLVNFIFKKVVLRATAKTQTELDDMVVNAISLPLLIGIVVAGIFVALQGLPVLAQFADLINLSFSVFYIFFISMIAIRVIDVFVVWYATSAAKKTKSKVDDNFLPIIKRLVNIGVLVFALMALLGLFGIELTAAVAALGVGGIAIALALQDTLKEFFAGGHVILDKPINIGDLIELESGDRGTVVDVGWRSTTIRTWSQNYVTLPNSKIANSKLINYTQPVQEIGFAVAGGVGYHEDLDKVEKTLIDEAKKLIKRLDCGVEGFTPLVRYQQFGDSNIDFKVIFRTKTFGDQYMVKHEFIKAVKKRFDKDGIEISWPVRKVYNHKGKGK